MKSLFSSSLRSGVMTLGLVVGLSAPSVAGPIQPDLPIAANAATPGIVPVRDSWAGGNDRQMMNNNWQWRLRRGGDWGWRSDRDWGGGDWRFRHHHRHFDNGDAALLGLGLGLGLGALAYDNYYDPYYYDSYPGYYYQPRRIYRTERLSSAHVQWCYNRYRSYRAWDNTFQPYYGPRQQCISPYG
jgi:hypothetical protein